MINQGDKLYAESFLQVGFNDNKLIVKDVMAISSPRVQGGKRYEFSGVTDLAPGYTMSRLSATRFMGVAFWPLLLRHMDKLQ